MSRAVSFICPGCGKEAQKPASALNRASREGRPIYCGRACFASAKTFLTPESKRERAAAYRQKNRERIIEHQRSRRQVAARDKILAAQLAYYYRNHEVSKATARAYHAANKERRGKEHRRWRSENQDKADLNNARAVLSTAMQIARSEVPSDLAEALVEQWKIKRWVREQLAIAAGTQRAETAKHGSVPKGCQSGPKASPNPSHRSTGE